MTPHLASGPRPVVGPGCCLDQTQGRGRRLHLLDLDNLHGSGNPSIRRIDQVRNDYDRLGLMDGDLVYGACMHEPGRWNREHVRRVAHICKVWPKGTVRPVAGKNGADKALVGKGLKLLIFHVAGAIFFLWFLGAPLSVSEWRESEGFVSYNWLFWSCRYPGLLLSGLGVLVSLPLLLWPGALSLPSRTKRRRQLAGGTQPEPSGSS